MATGKTSDDTDDAAREPKASGANIPESQRHTVQVKLRLDPAVADILRALAEHTGENVSATVARLVTAEAARAKRRAKRRVG